jgi:hypothetical protein
MKLYFKEINADELSFKELSMVLVSMISVITIPFLLAYLFPIN